GRTGGFLAPNTQMTTTLEYVVDILGKRLDVDSTAHSWPLVGHHRRVLAGDATRDLLRTRLRVEEKVHDALAVFRFQPVVDKHWVDANNDGQQDRAARPQQPDEVMALKRLQGAVIRLQVVWV